MPPKRMKPEIALEFKDVTIEIKVFISVKTAKNLPIWINISVEALNAVLSILKF